MPELKIDIKVDDGDAKRKLKDLGDTMDKAGKTGKKGIDDASGSLSGLKKQTDDAGSGLDGLKKKFESATGISASFKNALGAAGVAGAVTMLVNGFAEAIKIGANFEQKMATVGGVMRANKDDMAKLTAAARLMGETTEWSATQSAEALQYLGMAGFNATDAVKALPGMLDLATAGQLDLGRAADIATDGLTAMGMSVDQLGRFNDVLVGTITRSNTDIEKMGNSLKYVAPVASQMGYSIEEVSAAIGVMANAGLKGEMAGTGLSAVFLKLDKASKELGISSNKLPDVMKAIADKQWDATKIASVFGQEHVKTVAILKANMSTYHDLEKTLGNVEGESKKLADTMRNTVEGSFKGLASAVESFGIDIFNLYRDEVKAALDAATGFIRDHKAEVISILESLDEIASNTMTLGSDLGTKAREMVIGVVNDAIGFAEDSNAVVIQLGETYKRQYDEHMGLLANSQAQKNAAALQDIKRFENVATEQAKIQENTNKKISKASENHTKSEKKHIDDRLKAEQKAAEDRERAIDQMYRDLGWKADGWKDHEIANLAKQRDAFIKSAGDKEFAYKWFATEVQKIEDDITQKLKDEEAKRNQVIEDAADAKKSAYDMYYSLLGTKAAGYYDYEISKINEEVSTFVKATGDKEGAFNLYAEKVKSLDKSIADEMQANAAQNVGSWAWFEAEASKSMEALFENGRSALSDGLFDLLKGDVESFGDLWEGLWDDMLRILTDTLAKMAIAWAAQGIQNWLSPGEAFASAIPGIGSGESIGGGIFGSLGSTAIGKGAGKAWGWLTGGAAAGSAAVGGAYLGGSALATDLYLGTGALVDIGAGSAAGSGMLGSIGALASNPYTWGATAALVGGGLIARNAMEKEIRQSIDDTDFGFFDRATLNTSAANGGGSDEYAALANEAVAAAQGDVIGLVGRLADVVPSALKDTFLDQLADMSVHLGGGGMVIREDHLGEDLQVMHKGTLYAMLVDTFDPIIQTLQQYGEKYGADVSGQISAGQQLQQQFFGFDPEGFWTGADQQLFDQYYDWYNKIYNLSVVTNEQVTAFEAAAREAEAAAEARRKADEETRRATDELYRDLGPTAQGYRSWEAFKIEEQAAEYSAAGASAEIVSQWLEKEMVELDRKIDDALAKTLPSQSEYISAMEKMYDVVGSVAEGYEQWEIGKLADEMNRLAETTGETVLAQQWYNTELAKFMSSIGAETQGETTEAPAYASGGVINRLIVPRGEDGFAAVQYGEGVVSRQGMAALEALNSGQIGSGQPINIQVILDGEPIKTMVYKYGDDLRVKTSRRPDVAGSRVYR